MWNYSEMYSASLRPWGTSLVSASDALAEIHLSMIHYWGEVQREIIKRYTAPVVDEANVEQASFAAAGDDQATDLDEAPAHDDSAAEAEPEEDQPDMETSAAEEPVPLNAAMAILNHPALAAEAATRQADDAMDYEVRDDVADDIATEIQREVRQELNPSAT